MDAAPKLEVALKLACIGHRSQKRKGTEVDYICHPLEVVSLVLSDGGDKTAACAAACHDLLEDQGEEWQTEILHQLGEEVLAVVRGCSDHIGPKGGKKLAWRLRKDAYIEHLRNLDATTDTGRRILQVTAADKLSNARAIVRDFAEVGDAIFDRFTAGKDGTLWYYSTVAALLAKRLPGALTADLLAEVGRMITLAYQRKTV